MQPLPNGEEEAEHKLIGRAISYLECYFDELRPDPNVEWREIEYEVQDLIQDLKNYIGEH